MKNKISKFSFFLLVLIVGCCPIGKYGVFANNLPKVSLIPFQGLETTGARSITYFTFSSNRPFLAVSQFAMDNPAGKTGADGGNSDIFSLIYQWDGHQFIPFQRLPSHGARDWAYFNIKNNHFLALASLRVGNGQPYNLNSFSTIYEWDGCKFTPIQDILTQAAQEWTFFSIDKDFYLVVANYAENVPSSAGNNATTPKLNFGVNSVIYRWNENAKKFDSYQSILTQAAFNWEFFTVDNEHYLAVSNGVGPVSNIYIWKNRKFQLFQSIPSSKPINIKAFTIEQKHYLAISNLAGDSAIYMWDGKQFIFFQKIIGPGGRRFVFFTDLGNHFLAKINYLVGTQYQLLSQIYAWNGEKFVKVLDFPTYGGTDATFFTIRNTRYFAVSYGNKNKDSYRMDSEIYKFVVK